MRDVVQRQAEAAEEQPGPLYFKRGLAEPCADRVDGLILPFVVERELGVNRL